MEMEIKECRRDILDMVVDYMYGINIQPVEKDLEDLLDIAERFQMMDLKAEIGKVTAATITVDNYKELALRADKFNCKVLAEACIKFMVSNDIMLEWEEARQVPSMAVAARVSSERKFRPFRVVVVEVMVCSFSSWGVCGGFPDFSGSAEVPVGLSFFRSD